MTEFSFVANREVRWIPRGWQHPRDPKGRHVPLLPNGYCAANGFTEEEEAPEMPATTGPVRARERLPPGRPASQREPRPRFRQGPGRNGRGGRRCTGNFALG